MVDKLEGTADEGTAYALAVLCDSLSLHTVLFVAEVDCHTGTGEEEENAGLPGEGSELVSRFGFFHSLVVLSSCG